MEYKPIIYGIGEELLKALNNEGEININLNIKTSHNIYGSFNNHLVPISQHPLITPYTIMIDHTLMKKFYENACKNIIINLKNKSLFIKCSTEKDFFYLNNINEIEIFKRIKPLCDSEIPSSIIRNSLYTLIIIITLINNPMDLQVIDKLRRIINTYDRVNSKVILTLINEVLGLGSGSTPSGDDLVIGLLTALDNHVHELRKDLISMIYKTTKLSQALIKEIIEDQYYLITLNSLKNNICMKIESNIYSKIIDNIINIIRIGNTSGIFMALGLISGLLIRWNSINILKDILRKV
ncbi:oxamate carbamoyltransferase subunit AllH family protein [Vulcanisaeta thermophila]|uniref:oxamate carbamoyltransferase subunit AllH family protein n=1 Tax=Vulcanisaeta thermophila TaxID=867917 RepID=UPI001389C997|nr:DUF2877 domain-containing protein [Vulcanisaeta thermophila]